MQRMCLVFIFCFLPGILFAQMNVADASDSKWSFSMEGYYYFIPGDKNSLTVIGEADHKRLHLETRYNYESQNTASAFAGWQFKTGKSFKFSATPMAGIAFGNTNGFVPAIELNATYKIFDFYSESEYLIEFAGRENNFFYTWSELAVSPFDFLRTGISVQRTLLYQTKLAIQRGVFAQYSFWKLTAGAYYFNPFSENNLVIASLNIDF